MGGRSDGQGESGPMGAPHRLPRTRDGAIPSRIGAVRSDGGGTRRRGRGEAVPGAVGDRGGGGQDEPAGLDPLDADQAVGQLADRLGGPAEQDHLQAAAGVEVDVRRRHHAVEVVVLQLGQVLGDLAGVVVVDQRHDAHRLAVVVRHRLLDQRRRISPRTASLRLG